MQYFLLNLILSACNCYLMTPCGWLLRTFTLIYPPWNHTCILWAIQCWLKFAADIDSSLYSVADHSPSRGCVITGQIIGNLKSLKRLHNVIHWSMHVAWGCVHLSCYEDTDASCEWKNYTTCIDEIIIKISHWSCSDVCVSLPYTCLKNSEKRLQDSWSLSLCLFVSQQGTVRLQLGGFTWNRVWWFLNVCR